jgi:hypothetical protein
MARKSSLLESMRRNPRGDWGIDVERRVCTEHGLGCDPPKGGGSHYKVTHPDRPDILTVPARRPIKPIYIKKLVQLIDGVE